MVTSFDQKEKIRERLKGKKKRTKREKKVLAKGTAADKPKGRPLGARNKRGPEVFGVDETKLIKELRKRAKGNSLHQMADELHLGIVLANLRVIEEIKYVLDSNKIMLADIAESKPLLSALKGATAEVTSGLRALGLSATNRTTEADGDDMLTKLANLDLDSLLPQSLQHEYLLASNDLANTEGLVIDPSMDKTLLAKLKKPIRAYGDNDVTEDEPVEKTVHDPRKDGLVIS